MTKEPDYENLKPEDIKAEKVHFKIDKNAFKGPVNCSKCYVLMKKRITDLDYGDITLHISTYKCPKCGKELLSFGQAEKLEKAITLADAMNNKARFKFKRAMNFDGKSFFVRFPTDITHNWHKKIETEIIPLSANDYLIHLADK